MSKKASDKGTTPSLEHLEAELGRVKHRRNYVSALRSTIFSLLIVAEPTLEFVLVTRLSAMCQNIQDFSDRGCVNYSVDIIERNALGSL